MAARAEKKYCRTEYPRACGRPNPEKRRVIGFSALTAQGRFANWNLTSTSFLEVIADIISDAVIKEVSERELASCLLRPAHKAAKPILFGSG
jgi:hypothetical protein